MYLCLACDVKSVPLARAVDGSLDFDIKVFLMQYLFTLDCSKCIYLQYSKTTMTKYTCINVSQFKHDMHYERVVFSNN